MSEQWRDDLRDLRQRKLVFWAVVFSVLVHIVLLVLIFLVPREPPRSPEKDQAVWMDLNNMELPRSSEGEVMTSPLSSNRQKPDSARRLAAENNTAAEETHRADIPINENQAAPGPRSNRRPGAASRPSKKYDIPQVGEAMEKGARGVEKHDTGEPTKTGSSKGSSSVKELVSSVGYQDMEAGEGGGGGNLSPYNPNVGKAGSAINLNTKDFKYVGYFAGIKEKIEWAWVYPQEAQMMGQQGTLTLTFTILRSGQLKEVRRARTSGFPLLDDAAARAVRDAAAFAPFPDNWPDEEITIVANFTYQLIGVKSVF